MFDISKIHSLNKTYNLKINPELLKTLNDSTNKSIDRMRSQQFALLNINNGESSPPHIPYEFTKIVFIGIISFLAGSYFSCGYK